MPAHSFHEKEEIEAARDLLLARIPWIQRTVRSLGRRGGLADDEIEEFGGWVWLKLVEREYAVIREHRGESRLSTYLTAVLKNLLRDYRHRHWGRWRPSRAAQRRGPSAVLLDTLLHRDGLTPREAVEIARDRSDRPPPRRQLRDLALSLPPRPRPRRVTEAAARDVAAADHAQQRVRDRENLALARRFATVLREAFRLLAPQDARLLEMHYRQGHTIAHIASTLGLRQRALYTRRDRCLKQLREHLEASGLEREEVLDLVGWEGIDILRIPPEPPAEGPPEHHP